MPATASNVCTAGAGWVTSAGCPPPNKNPGYAGWAEELEESVCEKNNEGEDQGKGVQDSGKTSTNVPVEKWAFWNAS